jgi:outer membrane receptor protein involved in Fe transport
MKRNSVLFVLMGIALLARVYAGTNGILVGTVKDKQTREVLPGVNVLLPALQRGGVTDKNGQVEIQNLPAGSYEVRFTLIGYQTMTVKNVIINPDLRTKIDVQLQPTEVQLDEFIVTQEKPLIQRDVTGTTFIVTSREVTLLPVDKVVDVIRLKPGITAEGNVRGGKTTELVYFIDGLPVQDVLTGGLKTDIPNSSVYGLSLHTGGFEPEYGNALSGVVNIVTKTGTNEHRFLVKGTKDNLFGGTQVSKANEFEVSGSGPLVEDKLFYLGSLNGVFTGTRWWQDLQYFFSGTFDKTWSGFAKLDYLFSPTLRLGGQVLFSDRMWHDYEFNWRFNLAGLPPEHRRSYRIAAILSHTVNDNFFYTASLSKFYLKNSIGEGTKGDYVDSEPYQYDFFLRYVVDGQRAWWSRTTQESYVARFDGAWKPAEQHLLKFGGDFVYYNINSDLVKYEPRKTYFGKPLVNEPQLNFNSAYTYHPRQGSLYLQDKIDIANQGVLINLGLRYDFLNPTATRPAIEEIPISDTSYATARKPEVKASLKQQLSPRLGAAMQLAENGYLFVNFGWYIQYPLFDYLYTGLDRAGLARGVGALTGNPDLEPERTKSYEISVKYSFEHNIVVSATYFKKEMTNQIDTKTFIAGDSKVAGTFGFAEFVNNPFAQATGLEVVVARERGEWLTGELSYTLMDAEGTSVSAYDGFYIAQYGLPPAIRVYPLSWDERHSVKLVTTLSTPWDLDLTVVAEAHSGRPYTNYPTSTGFDPIDGGLFAANNARMPGNSNVDLKLSKYCTFAWWPNSRVTFYFDVSNLTNEKSVRWMDSNARIGGELGDPGGYFIGRRTYLGFTAEF